MNGQLSFLLQVVLVFFLVLFSILFFNAFTIKSLQFSPSESHFERVDCPVDQLVQTLSEAVKIPTISFENASEIHYDELLRLREFLATSFPLVHSRLRIEVVGKYSLLYTWEGTKSGSKLPILIAGHLDVVPIEKGTESNWVYPPFSGHIDETFVWGRGSMDDKMNTIGILEAVEFLLRKGFQPIRTIFLAFGHDEEISGVEGAYSIARLLEERKVKLDYILDEGLFIMKSGLSLTSKPIAVVGTAEKGYLSIDLSVETQGGHSSIPPLGSTSIGIISAAIVKLEANPFPASLSPVKKFLEHVAPETNFLNRFLLSNLWLFEPLIVRLFASKPTTNAQIRTTSAVTLFHSGMKQNVIPYFASATVNFRISPTDSIDSVLDHVSQVIDDPRIKITPRAGGMLDPSPITSTDTPAFRTLQKAILQAFGDVIISPGLMPANTDTRHYWNLTKNIFRFSPVLFGDDDFKRFHGTNERIEISNYIKTVDFYNFLIRHSCEFQNDDVIFA